MSVDSDVDRGPRVATSSNAFRWVLCIPQGGASVALSFRIDTFAIALALHVAVEAFALAVVDGRLWEFGAKVLHIKRPP